MADIIRVENYDVRECEVEHGRQRKHMEKAVQALSEGIAAMHNGAIMELLEGLTYTTIKQILPKDIETLLRAYGLNLQRIIFNEDTVKADRNAPWIPASGWYLIRRVDRGIMAFVSEPLIIREDRKITAKIFIWRSPRLGTGIHTENKGV